MNTYITIGYRFWVDACLIMMVIYYLNVDVGREINVSQLVASVVIFSIIYFMLHRMLNGQLTLLHFALLVVISFIVNAWLGLLLFHAVIIASFLTWRLALYYFKPDTDQEKGMLITSVLLGFFLYLPAVFLENPDASFGLYFILMQFLIVMGGKMLIRIMNVGEDDHSGWTAKLSYVVGIPSGILIVTLGLFWLTPFIIRTFYSLFSWVTYQVGLGATPFFDWFKKQQRDVEVTPSDKEENVSQEDQNVLEQVQNQTETISAETIMYIIIGIFLIIGVTFYYRYRNRFIRRDSKIAVDEKTYSETEKSPFLFSEKKKNSKKNIPKNEIRKAFFELERWAAKHQLGRYYDETVEQWLQRLQLDPNRYTDAIHLYQKVRYGEQNVTEDQKRHYTDQLTDLKNTLKQKLT
ncbi:DUF4129 domain-containing protein [Allobacillus sp. SKP2-8]|uniref:DUF4129 domain-containing protein n=1 Tax=unclassified Allobacillus TaxID=2628859 RepID=UPI001182A006|nr:DUF4129 domain-containing protein [Allobacillus sp. SKP2-8]TSJ66334.1 DUF4129 domain-containing protein [Allobacillus sp. SKP2-8]